MALYLCWPVVVSMRELRQPLDRRRPTPRRLARLRARTLLAGRLRGLDLRGGLGFFGLCFPGWMRAQAGRASSLTTQLYVRFVVSQILCGMIAATMTFFHGHARRSAGLLSAVDRPRRADTRLTLRRIPRHEPWPQRIQPPEPSSGQRAPNPIRRRALPPARRSDHRCQEPADRCRAG